MWQKIKVAAYTAFAFVVGFGGFVLGMLFYRNYLDKPETVNETNVDIAKIKARGNGAISVTLPVPEFKPENTNDTNTVKPRKKLFNFLKKK